MMTTPLGPASSFICWYTRGFSQTGMIPIVLPTHATILVSVQMCAGAVCFIRLTSSAALPWTNRILSPRICDMQKLMKLALKSTPMATRKWSAIGYTNSPVPQPTSTRETDSPRSLICLAISTMNLMVSSQSSPKYFVVTYTAFRHRSTLNELQSEPPGHLAWPTGPVWMGLPSKSNAPSCSHLLSSLMMPMSRRPLEMAYASVSLVSAANHTFLSVVMQCRLLGKEVTSPASTSAMVKYTASPLASASTLSNTV
mmetsp:Transcript_71474/g.119706  ORF Transcript_71474/g.119706 Transcript_71474/m.119706 type:complete len:255 (-) Transcript_71474:399-1163(-)